MVMAEPGEARAEERLRSEAFSGVDSEHMFGFTVGSDIGSAGEIEIEGEQDSGFGKRMGPLLRGDEFAAAEIHRDR